jgi:hypothetical protein
MTLNHAQRAHLLDALDAWRDAEKAYGDEAAKCAGAWWMDAGRPPEGMWLPLEVTPEAWETLRRLRGAANEARAAYYEIAASFGESPPLDAATTGRLTGWDERRSYG